MQCKHSSIVRQFATVKLLCSTMTHSEAKQTEMSEFGAEKFLLHGHARRWGDWCSKKAQAPLQDSANVSPYVLLNCGVGEDSWESLELQGYLTSQSQKKINPEYSLQGLMLKLKVQHSGHLMRKANSLENTLMLGKIEGRRRRGRQRMRWTWVWASSESWWWTGKSGVLQSMGSQGVGHDSDWTKLNCEQSDAGGKRGPAFPMKRKPFVAAAAAAKSLQSCPILCDPIDGSPPGSPVPGILQARTLEWVAISFSNAWKWKVKVNSLSRVGLLATPWTAAHQAPPPTGFARQEYWSAVPLPSLYCALVTIKGTNENSTHSVLSLFPWTSESIWRKLWTSDDKISNRLLNGEIATLSLVFVWGVFIKEEQKSWD